MNVLLLGSGGREHALAWKLTQSPLCGKLYIAPGNPGTARFGTNVSLNLLDFQRIATCCHSEKIDLLIVGPEEPLVRGITDYLRQIPSLKNMIICGPGALGARLEGSKAFAKGFMSRWDIPTARFGEFSTDREAEAISFLDTFQPPYVIKADGLAAGKGVVILNQKQEAEKTIQDMFGGQFGTAGQTIVLEEFLEGVEFSVFVLTDGRHYQVLPIAKDYKRIGEGDTGPNTGGMGAVSPVSFVNSALMEKVRLRIIEPTINGLQAERIPYQGFIFIGLIMVGNDPFVIEYNCRMGDPETEVVMPLLKTDLIELLVAMGENRLDTVPAETSTKHAATIMMVSEGYPGDYPKGRIISGANQVADADGMIFQAGTAMHGDELITAGGRVLACTAVGDDLPGSLSKAYQLAETITFEGAFYRKDIGRDVL